MTNEKKKNKLINLELVGLIVSLVALFVSISAVKVSHNTAITDRKTAVYTEAIVYLDKIAFISDSSNLGFGDILKSDVNDEWVIEHVLDAVDINTRLELFDEAKANEFWSIVVKIYSSEHFFDHEMYQKLKKEIAYEISR